MTTAEHDTAPDATRPRSGEIGEEPPQSNTAPRRERSDKGQPRGPRKKRGTKLVPTLTQAFHFASGALMAVDPFDAIVVGANADKLAGAWAPVLERYPRLMAAIANMEKGGVWGAAIIASGSVLLPIIAHHRPDSLPPFLREPARAMAEKYMALAGPLMATPPNPANGAGAGPGAG